MKSISYIVIALIVLSCNTGTDHYKLSGNAYGYADGTKLFVYEIDGDNQPVIKDTLIIENEKFTASYPKVTDIPLNFLKVDGSNANILYFVENEPLNAQIYADSITASYVLGGKQNELYQEYLSTVESFNKQRIKIRDAFQKAQADNDTGLMQEARQQNTLLMEQENAYKQRFVTENNNSVFGLMLLSEMLSRRQITAAEVSELLDNLNPKMAAHPVATKLAEAIETAKKAEVGSIAPSFEAPTPNGEMLSLKDAMGKYTIIDFWASWCKPCRMENPNVVRVYEKYHDKGLNIISVSLDREGQKDRWVKAIEDDNMDWYHVSNLQFWQDPIAKEYNVRSIPTTFLLDEKGTIIDKNLRGNALEARIASLLDN